MTMRRRAATGFAGLTALTLLIAACGIPTGEDSFDPIAAEDVPFRLPEQSTTSTSTTTAPTSTLPPTSLADAPETTAESTTTTLPTETVAVYFLSRDGLQPVPNELPRGYGIGQLVASLEAGPPDGAAGVGLDTLIDEGLIVDADAEGGVVTVELDESGFDQIEPRDQRPAIAQIVLTLTANLRGVGQISFTLAGEPIRVPKGNGLLSETGEPLAFDDYAIMLAESTVGPTPDTTTTQPTTTDTEPPTTESSGGRRSTTTERPEDSDS